MSKSRIEEQTGITERENGVLPPKSIFLLEAEAVEATLKLWLGLGPMSAQRIAAMAQNHLGEHIARLQQQAKS
jgi:hypothetical protein